MSLLRSLPFARRLVPALAVGLSLGVAMPASAARPKPPRKSASHRTTSHKTSRKSPKKSTHHVAAKAIAPRVDSSVVLPPMPAFAQLSMVNGEFRVVPPESSLTTGIVKPFAAFSASAERLLSAMVDRARGQLGTRYVLGGNKPDKGLDCSSFARYAMEALGIRLPRTAREQARIGEPVPRDRTMLKPGDLLTFGSRSKVSHVGIYLGEGRFIHASVTSRKIIETTIDRNPRLFRKWQGARRLLSSDDSTSKARGDG